MSFADKLAIGKIGESVIASWFLSRGYSVLPVYEKEVNEGKGPTLFCSDKTQLISPDMLVFNSASGKVYWIEAKHKSAFTWHRNTRAWVTGIDLHHYTQYLEVAKRTPWNVWLLFLHRSGIAKDTPDGMISPVGLFGGNIALLSRQEHHRYENHGRSGMVYWAHTSLKKLDLGVNDMLVNTYSTLQKSGA